MKRFTITNLLPFIGILLCFNNVKAQNNIQIDLRKTLLAGDGLSVSFEFWATALPTYTGTATSWDTLLYRADASVGTYNIASVDVAPTAAVDASSKGYITNPGPPPVGSSKFGITFSRTGGQPDLIIGIPVKLASVTFYMITPFKSRLGQIISRTPPNYSTTQSTYYTNGDGNEYVLAASSNSILPIDILSFTGVKTNSGNLLNWTTANAVNFSHFELQRSTDGANFKVIYSILPNSNNTYKYIDANSQGTNFYRLALVDIDGTFKYSSTVAIIDNSVSFTITNIYPIPATNQLNVIIYTPVSTNATFSITDLSGKTMLQEVHNITFNAIQPLNVANLPQGTYFLTIYTANTKQVGKFIKL